MVDKKLSEFSSVQASDVSDLVVLYLDGNNTTKNGRLPFSTFVSGLALLSGNNTFTGTNTFEDDVVFSGDTTFNNPINGTCSRAVADASGNNIANTYATKTELDQKSSFKLFHHDWFDYQLNDMEWLRADTFSWQNGTVYTNAYNHLVDDWNNWWATHQQSEMTHDVIDGQEVWCITASDGHKIAHVDEVTSGRIDGMYNATGVAWYYILDTTNQRFKLPRTKYGFVGLRDTVGKFVPESLPIPPDHTHKVDACVNGTWGGGGSNIGRGTVTSSNPTWAASDIYKVGAPVQQRATQMYLYFYVGQFSQSATEQTAGLNSELFNGKMDRDMSNMNASQTAKETIVGWGMPDYSAGVSISTTSDTVYQAAKDGLFVATGSGYNAGSFIYVQVLDANDNVVIDRIGNYSASRSGGYAVCEICLPVPKAYKIKVKEKANVDTCAFYPMKGV